MMQFSTIPISIREVPNYKMLFLQSLNPYLIYTTYTTLLTTYTTLLTTYGTLLTLSFSSAKKSSLSMCFLAAASVAASAGSVSIVVTGLLRTAW